jgi:hypothetical protein
MGRAGWYVLLLLLRLVPWIGMGEPKQVSSHQVEQALFSGESTMLIYVPVLVAPCLGHC